MNSLQDFPAYKDAMLSKAKLDEEVLTLKSEVLGINGQVAKQISVLQTPHLNKIDNLQKRQREELVTLSRNHEIEMESLKSGQSREVEVITKAAEEKTRQAELRLTAIKTQHTALESEIRRVTVQFEAKQKAYFEDIQYLEFEI